jgi:hypothetical protein
VQHHVGYQTVQKNCLVHLFDYQLREPGLCPVSSVPFIQVIADGLKGTLASGFFLSCHVPTTSNTLRL